MTPAEKDAIEMAVNQFLQGVLVLVVLSWWLWWAVRKVGADRLFSWPQAPTQEAKAPPKALTAERPAYVSVMSHEPQTVPKQTNSRPTDEEMEAAPPAQLDRTRTGAVKALVREGWSVSEIRAVLKGDFVALSQEIKAAREELGADLLIVRDGPSERLISR